MYPYTENAKAHVETGTEQSDKQQDKEIVNKVKKAKKPFSWTKSCCKVLIKYQFQGNQTDQDPENKNSGKDEEQIEEQEQEDFVLEQSPVDINSPHLYELFAVVIHRGSSAGTK